MKKTIFLILLILIIPMTCIAAKEPIGFIAQDTPWATPYYVIDSGVPGPIIFIIGGTHGNELAGWQAAEKLLAKEPDRGKLLIIPRANIKGVALRQRRIKTGGDLNRAYPGVENGLGTELIAYDIFHLIEEMQPDLVLDLHESLDFYQVDEKRLGQTLVAYPSDEEIWYSLMAIEKLNEEIEVEVEQFTLLQGPVEGSTTWAVGKFLQIPTITVETCRKLDLASRIDYQIKVVNYLLEQLEVTLH